MQTLILTVLVLGVLVFIHELGHFMTAKWAGIAVPRFSMGLGPRVAGFKIGETDYCLSAVPFGGYVKMAGMAGEEAFEGLEGGAVEEYQEEMSVPVERRYDSKSIPWRLLVISAGVLMNFALGWVIYVGLAYTQGQPAVLGTTVEAVDSLAADRFAPLGAIEPGATIAAVQGREVENWHEIDTAIREGGGSTVDLTLATGETIRVPISGDGDRGAISNGLIPRVKPLIASLEDGGPAELGGLREGDLIVSIDGIATPAFQDVSDVVRPRPNRTVPIVVERPTGEGVETVTLSVQTGSESSPRPEDGKFVESGWLGVTAAFEQIEYGLAESFIVGTQSSWRAGSLIVTGLIQLVTGDVSLRALGGPVAIGQLTGHFARQGLASLLGWVALFSINLAILNLLPIPVLDGGHILFIGIEAMRGRPLSERQKLRLSQVGLAFLVLLMAWAFTADILRLVGF